MLYCRHESLLTRFTAASRASCRCRTEPGRDCQDVCGLGGNDQTLSQTTTRDRSRVAKSDPRPSCHERSAVAGPLESAVSSPSRCGARASLGWTRKKRRSWPANKMKGRGQPDASKLAD